MPFQKNNKKAIQPSLNSVLTSLVYILKARVCHVGSSYHVFVQYRRVNKQLLFLTLNETFLNEEVSQKSFLYFERQSPIFQARMCVIEPKDKQVIISIIENIWADFFFKWFIWSTQHHNSNNKERTSNTDKCLMRPGLMPLQLNSTTNLQLNLR